ncbi:MULTISPECIES: YbaL family putative K(+) efflux transporter [unclassified Shinella]|uniref:YbaL family putative K(+) efflux transporter n=1 Tax=unclassified Shinella TaxID=2643062 RepID=UPI00225C8723|nr:MULTISPECIES: YbaL family putative K(+) efflux transporter [unclassified Shinella]MCO5138282.1 Kef family K(+) transporter [Shinella sp.]MDC7255118.1 Kef family K(+) transporter [Shinella sp. YE25]CAI0337878.1 putative transporter YbaL [Rhizobiaceae bacterium]CAK7256350.1 putative transporter YbaL [Shinella sp. WSC3-e]
MPHATPLIATLVAGISLAFLAGLVAHRFRLPPIAGYLLAGVFIGPFTPGFVADQKLANELAEIGVILLMFGVGLHFSLKDLLSVRAIAIPGAIGQIAVATVFGLLVALAMGWSAGSGFVFGLSLSVASTVVLLRALQERRMVETERGRIAVGWLIVEDLVMVLTLVLLPPLAGVLGGTAQTADVDPDLTRALGIGAVWTAVGVTALKVSAFIALMLVVGRKVIPMILHYVAHTGSRELFRLSVLAIALGVAYGSAKLFGVSFALGAFFAGMVLAESQLSQQAARETLPLRDAFAVLFFVSVGMLFNPVNLIERPLAILATFVTIVFIKSAAAYLIVKAFGYPRTIALAIAASLAQIGEFSFILVVLGVGLDLLPAVAQDLVVAGALFSILVNPLLFMAVDHYGAKLDAAETQEPEGSPDAAPQPEDPAEDGPEPTTLTDHAIVVGYGRVGRRIVERLRAAGMPVLVIEERAGVAAALRESGAEAIGEPAGGRGVLAQANITGARWFVTAIPDAFAAGTLIEQARSANGAIRIVARATSEAEAEHLRQFGANHIVIAKEEVAAAMADRLLAGEARKAPDEDGAQGELNLATPSPI